MKSLNIYDLGTVFAVSTKDQEIPRCSTKGPYKYLVYTWYAFACQQHAVKKKKKAGRHIFAVPCVISFTGHSAEYQILSFFFPTDLHDCFLGVVIFSVSGFDAAIYS